MAAQDNAATGSEAETSEAGDASNKVSEDAAPGEAAGSANAGAASDALDGESAAPAQLSLPDGAYLPTGGATSELPQGYTLAGTLTEAQAGGAGLTGCGYYTNPEEPGVCYVAQGDGSYLRWELAGE